MEELLALVGLLSDVFQMRAGEDSLLWLQPQSGKFELRSFCKALVNHKDPSFPWNGIWGRKLHPCGSLCLEGAHCKILQSYYLIRRKHTHVSCCICTKDGKLVDHFTHCLVA